MYLINYEELKKKIIGNSVPKPLSGEISGHAAGEPFDKLVYSLLKDASPSYTFKQHEYLNYLYLKNTDQTGFKARQSLFNSPTVMFLLARGKDATDKWNIQNQFEEKQNDTADMLIVKDDFFELIDVKTTKISKSAQPPNIISSYKLAQVCAKMIDNGEFNTFTINYFQIDWELDGNMLLCVNAHMANLFKSQPDNLYINWAAGMQIQFKTSELVQNFVGSKENWAKEYLKHYVLQAKKRMNTMTIKFITPFEKYITN